MTEKPLTAKQELLLLFLSIPVSTGTWPDPIRLMKGLFLFSKKIPEEWLPPGSLYNFEPYLYGPCSFEIYSDLDTLVRDGYVTTAQAPGYSWNYYFLTKKGKRVSEDIRPKFDMKTFNYLSRIKNFVMSVSFSDLLAVVYKGFPSFAVKSVFQP